MVLVKCPKCKKTKYSKGEKIFHCCGKSWSITHNIVKDEAGISATNLIKPAIPNDTSNDVIDDDIIAERQEQKLIMVKPKEEENILETPKATTEKETFGCESCGKPVIEGQKHCGNCGVELAWE